jgi:hypothetical protein
MNDTLYRDLLERWIPYENRPILQKQDFWLYAYKKIMYDKHRCSLLVDISLHAATPCIRRYCICVYFTVDDKAKFHRLKYKGKN